jgi:hypothetical protein
MPPLGDMRLAQPVGDRREVQTGERSKGDVSRLHRTSIPSIE